MPEIVPHALCEVYDHEILSLLRENRVLHKISIYERDQIHIRRGVNIPMPNLAGIGAGNFVFRNRGTGLFDPAGSRN
jgi:hypothetical protein